MEATVNCGGVRVLVPGAGAWSPWCRRLHLPVDAVSGQGSMWLHSLSGEAEGASGFMGG